jgi:mRNA-degrading endonuclease RelE of RelBE toxin-antitoxin system
MADKFRVLTTPAFERQARKAVRNRQELAGVLEEILATLRSDPHNVTGKHKIRKLSGVAPGDGQWRIRFGDYRARYDIAAHEVVLHSFRDRKDAYR